MPQDQKRPKLLSAAATEATPTPRHPPPSCGNEPGGEISTLGAPHYCNPGELLRCANRVRTSAVGRPRLLATTIRLVCCGNELGRGAHYAGAYDVVSPSMANHIRSPWEV